jgi:hypothetical protein
MERSCPLTMAGRLFKREGPSRATRQKEVQQAFFARFLSDGQ